MENYSEDINEKISIIMTKCNDLQIYSNIMQDLFTNGIFKPSTILASLLILPELKEKQLKDNFTKNNYKIISFIKELIKLKNPQNPGLDIYQVLSCIYGAFLGDAMGAFCEFSKPDMNNSKKIFKLYNTVIGGVKGQVTDDSEMALSMAYAIMDITKKEELITDYIYFYYGAWFKSDPLDNGTTTKNAVELFDFAQFHPLLNNFKNIEMKIINENIESLSNGFLMRKSPFIAWFYYRFYDTINQTFSKIDNIDDLFVLYQKIKELSKADNRCTNPNDEVNVVSGFYCLMALMAIYGLNSNLIIDRICSLCNHHYFKQNQRIEKFVSDTILYYVSYYKTKNFDFYKTFGDLQSKENVYKHMGYYLHAFKLTLYYLCQFDVIEYQHIERKYKTIMNQICNLGGDTDTNCCIVGTIIGPLIGMANFGNEFYKMLELVPPNREIYSVSLVLLFIVYLKKSNRDEKLLQNDKYFLQQILTMLYGNIELNY